MNPQTHLFNAHIQSYAYEIGELKGQWGVVDFDPLHPAWPVVLLWVAASPKSGKPDRYYFRFDFTGYPATAPTACPWNPEKNEKLVYADWPRGGPMINSVFNTGWNGGNSLYAPCDRGGDLPGHPNWANEHPVYYWKPNFTFITYLKFLHEILNSGDYQHV